ncbi:MAG: hypothetical protein QMD14_05460 [Candidatus Aenigmarchaeota archaeon]|nr:hypothetical protein [Candidatus Aenigmarchaeota archaeon]
MSRSVLHFVLSILTLTLLCSSLLVPAIYAGEVPGSGEVTVKPVFQIEAFDALPKEVGVGEEVSLLLTIKNNDDKVRTFYAIANIKDPNGKEETLSHVTKDLKPKEKSTLTLYWFVKEGATSGYYSVSIVVWTEPYKGEIVEKPNAFKVIVSLYDQQSQAIKNRWENAYLISISKEELEENRQDIVESLKKPVESTAIKETLLSEVFRISVEETLSEILKEVFPKDVIIKIAIDIADGNYEKIPLDALKAFLTEGFKEILEFKLIVYLIGVGVPPPLAAALVIGGVRAVNIAIKLEKPLKDVFVYYAIYPLIESRITFGIQFMDYTAIKLNHVNFIIIKKSSNEFEVNLISYEYNFDGNNVDKMAGKAILYYIGTYDRLHQIFLKKMGG